MTNSLRGKESGTSIPLITTSYCCSHSNISSLLERAQQEATELKQTVQDCSKDNELLQECIKQLTPEDQECQQGNLNEEDGQENGTIFTFPVLP